eukprot:TRINITY_DN2517_c0_g1_i1.p1 TRINITY_DN2517_c0_g1~~TRINITY_DN2517_c0_g1_i1.p1  ORF type:complete len:642 (-),score=209.63 TRINITY_DN2517_c0_g1_i1:83-2008(-)
MAEDQEQVLFEAAAEAKCGFFSLFSERYFVLTASQLRWYDKVKDFENSFPAEKTLDLSDLLSITVLEGNEKWPGQFEILSSPDVKWELRCKTTEEMDEWILKLPTPPPTEEPDSTSEMPQDVTIPAEDFHQMQQQLRDMTSELTLLRLANGAAPAEGEDSVQAPAIVVEFEALKAELENSQASLERSEQSNASLAARLCEQDASMAELEERASGAEAQAIRLTEMISVEKGESAHSEGELQKQIKMIEADKQVLKDVLEAQIKGLQDKVQAQQAVIDSHKSETAAAVGASAQSLQERVVELEKALEGSKLELEQAAEEKANQRANYRMELDTTRSQLQVRDAELEASRAEEARVNGLLFEVQEELRSAKEDHLRSSDAQQRADKLEEELAAERQAHASTKEDAAMDAMAKGKVASKKVSVAQSELSKTLSTLESTVNQLRASQGQCEALENKVQLLQVHTEQVMHAWNQEREATKARGRHKQDEDADDRFTKLSEIQHTVNDEATAHRERSGSELSRQGVAKDVNAFSDAIEYSTEKRALTAEAEAERLRAQVSELTQQLNLPSEAQEDVRTLRMVALLREESAQARKEKAEAVAGMLLTERDNEALKEANVASSEHIAQLMSQLHKVQTERKKSRNPFKK